MEAIKINGLELRTKTFLVKEIYDALDKNGFEHLRGTWFEGWNDGKPVGACVLGQAALNLNVVADYGDNHEVHDDDPFDNLLKRVVKYPVLADFVDVDDFYAEEDRVESLLGHIGNQAENYSLLTQLDKFNVPADSKWLRDDLTGVGSTIIHWNDSYDLKQNKITWKYEFVYKLPTYEDVAKMAFELMEPYFDQTVELMLTQTESVSV
jgi:hypothetical protein